MTIKIRFHGETAIIRWKNPMEKQFLKSQLTMFRDSMAGKVPILLRDERGDEIPKMQMRPVVQPPISGKDMIVASGAVIAPSPALSASGVPAVVVKLDKPEGSTC